MAEQTHVRILKSTTIIGGSSAINVVFQIIQSKAAAVLLGPSGVGLMGLFNAAIGLAVSVSGMGISTSGVRQIAEAAENGDEIALGRTAQVFRRLALILGLAGGLLFFILRSWISQVTFGSTEYAAPIGWLSLAVFFMVVATSQQALIRGVRRIGDLARVSVVGVAVGTLLGIPVMYWWGIYGVAFYLLGVASATILVSWWYARKVRLMPVQLSWREFFLEGRRLITLGTAFMTAGLTTLAATYLVKTLVTRQLGLEATGLFQAAGALSNVYVGFILGAMGADFYPHLSGAAHDNARSNQLINAQVEIGLLLAVPGILAILALGPWVLTLLYSPEFTAAFAVLRWQTLGTFMRVISWPLGFLLLARGKGLIFFFTELSTNLIYLGFVWLGIHRFGLQGAGMAFWGMYIYYTILIFLVARDVSGFRWSPRNLKLGMWIFPATGAGFILSFISPITLSLTLGLALTLAVGAFAMNSLYKLVGASTARSYLKRIQQRLGWGEV